MKIDRYDMGLLVTALAFIPMYLVLNNPVLIFWTVILLAILGILKIAEAKNKIE